MLFSGSVYSFPGLKSRFVKLITDLSLVLPLKMTGDTSTPPGGLGLDRDICISPTHKSTIAAL